MGGGARGLGSALLLAVCVAGGWGCKSSESTQSPPPAPLGEVPPPVDVREEPPGDADAGVPPVVVRPEPPAPDAGSAPLPVARCEPTGGEPRWLEEGEPLEVRLRCATGLAEGALRFTVDPLPPGASLDEERGVLRWTPAKDAAAVWRLTILERTTGEVGTLTVGVADNWKAPGNVPVVDPARYTEEYGLPVFHLSFVDRLTAGGYRPAQLVYRGHAYAIEAKYRGATSSAFPKRSYTLKFQEDDAFNEPFLAGGFNGRRRVVLISPFNDNSYLRPRLAFNLWNRMSPGHVQVKAYSAVLFVNGRYWGLFTVADHVGKHLLRRNGLSADGELFKAVDGNANFSRTAVDGLPKDSLADGFEKKEGLPLSGHGAYAAPIALTAFVADASDGTFRAGWGSRVETRDYEDWWIFNTLILGADTSAKNAYHYRDTPAQGRWRFIPWDLDATFGQGWNTKRHAFDELPDFTWENRLFRRMLADPAIAGPMRERYRALLREELSAEEVLALLEECAEEIRPAALRDEARWGATYRNFERWDWRKDFTTHDKEIDYLREWIRKRWTLLERRLP
ncbi:CotH kinase family protein [Myxococcaceae bacterium GXIMD 01537]